MTEKPLIQALKDGCNLAIKDNEEQPDEYNRGWKDAYELIMFVAESYFNCYPDILEWVNSFDTSSATKCFEAVNILKERLEHEEND